MLKSFILGENNDKFVTYPGAYQPSRLNLSSESSDLDFVYDDADEHSNEIAELYSYTEEPEFFLQKKAFEDLMGEYGLPIKWTEMSDGEKEKAILRLLDTVEMSQRNTRMQAARAVLYLIQGVFGECLILETQAEITRANVFLLYDYGVFNIFVQLLNMEIENSSAATSALRKPAVSLGDSTDLRIILNVLYTFVEVMRVPVDSDTDEMKQRREAFQKEIASPLYGFEELLAHTLFQMVTRFCSGNAPHFPIKKILLLLWKLILVSLGGTDELRRLKALYREEATLPPVPDDTIEITKTMRAASPPVSASDLIEAQQQRKNNRPFKRQSLVKQSSMDDSLAYEDLDNDTGPDEELRYIEEHQQSGDQEREDYNRPPTPRPTTPVPASLSEQGDVVQNKGLPFVPKVRPRDIDNFLDHTRIKFIGFQLSNDHTSLAGLPLPIHEGLKVLKQHVYVSLAEVQISREEEISKLPLSKKEASIPQTPVEVLYHAILPSLPQYMIALLKILLAAAPTSKAKTESINIMADVLPEEMPMTVIQSLKLGIDVNRHKEIIVKATSSIILLLLKHLKINHVYQFEYMSQQLMFANCIPLVLKFFNQNIMSYILAKNTISVIDFPACVIGEQPELTEETLEMGDQAYCWRNLFSCINLLRLLNKLTKWKHSRIMMLVVFKSAPILKRALKVKQAMMQLYVLKLLKMQTKYLGRSWRKSNMKTISAIYQKVRHRLNDDWAYGNDLDARPWDFQAEEFALQASINRFHNRRYDRSGSLCNDPDYQAVDNNILSVLGREIELTDDFKYHYESWVTREVFKISTDWDQLLNAQYV